MSKNIKLIDNLNNAKNYKQSCALYCIALDWYKFDTPEFVYNLHRSLADYLGYDFLNLTRGQKSYISRLSNILTNPHYFYYFVKKWVLTLNYVKFCIGCKLYQKQRK